MGVSVWVVSEIVQPGAAGALLCQGLYLTGIFWAAAAGAPTASSRLIAGLQPAVVLLAVCASYRRAPSRAQVCGVVAGMVGVALTAGAVTAAATSVLALALPVMAMLALAAGTVLRQVWRPRVSSRSRGSTDAPAMPLMESLALQSVFTAGFAVAVAVPGGDLLPPLTPAFWLAVAWIGVAGLCSSAAYYRAIDVLGAERASALLYVTPATAAISAAVPSGEPVRAITLGGLALSSLGAAVLVRSAPIRPSSPGAPGDVSPPR